MAGGSLEIDGRSQEPPGQVNHRRQRPSWSPRRTYTPSRRGGRTIPSGAQIKALRFLHRGGGRAEPVGV